jgi:hypothetical protein
MKFVFIKIFFQRWRCDKQFVARLQEAERIYFVRFEEN